MILGNEEEAAQRSGVGTAPTAGHLQMKPRAVLAATAQAPPFLQGFPLQPSMTDSQRRPGIEGEVVRGQALPQGCY